MTSSINIASMSGHNRSAYLIRILINGSVNIFVPFVNDCDSILKIKLATKLYIYMLSIGQVI